MGRIYYIMGKSAVGKDTIYKELFGRCPGLKAVVPYTTRPIRAGETDGVEYFFTTKAGLDEIKRAGKLIELRTYQTVMGPWDYFTVDDGQIDIEGNSSYLMIGTLASYESMLEYFGGGVMAPIYIEIPDGMRLKRAIKREEKQKTPNYLEVCRRYIADEEDFSEEYLEKLSITRRFSNVDLEECLKEIVNCMKM